MVTQGALQKLWLQGNASGMAAGEQLNAWALREAWLDGKTGKLGMQARTAGELTKVGGGQPTNVVVKDLMHRVGNGEVWHPEKQYGE